MLTLFFALSLTASGGPTRAHLQKRSLDRTIEQVEQMVRSPQAQKLARENGLSLVNVTWEDTGRYQSSSWGPNISDMTIGVRDSQGRLHPMPVFRFDNYNDKTVDLQSDNIWVRTGNERGATLKTTRLTDILGDVQRYLSRPQEFRATSDDLTAPRDSHYLVSAQACFLPISTSGKSTFTPVIYNYQSQAGAPAVMTIVATREGTSIQVVENTSGYMSEELYFNANGKRAPFTATRLTTFKAEGGDATTRAAEATENAGLDVVLIIQVPLKHVPMSPPSSTFGAFAEEEYAMAAPMDSLEKGHEAPRPSRSDVETAVIGHGRSEGRFTEINDLRIERDTRFPVRVTAQFYKATSNAVISARDVRELKDQIDQVYADGDYVGSLVTGRRSHRPTDWTQRTAERRSSPWAAPIWEWHKAR